MAPKPGKKGERSAASATRFTATTPHASSKRASPAPAARNPISQPASASSPAGAAAAAAAKIPAPAAEGTIPPISPPGAVKETPAQRVARLRAAHEAAKVARISPFDRFLERTRPILNSAHKITVMGLVSLTVVAGVMTGYTAFDMMRHNRKRQAEFIEAQKKMATDSLEAARLAYMRGDANDEQIQLVEEAQARAASQGFQLPSILSAPTPIKREAADVKTTEDQAKTLAEGKSSNLLDMLPFWGTKKEGASNAGEAVPKEARPQRTFEEKQTMLEQARAAFEKEKENQKTGGPLDRLGSAEAAPEASSPTKETEQPKKKGWLW